MKTLYTDIVVVGGGSAGVAAAIAAGKSGCKVILVEQLGYLGGKATAAEVGTICGLYKFSQNATSEFIVKGFAKSFAEALQKKSSAQSIHNTIGLHYLPYHIQDYKDLCLKLINESHVELLLDAEVKEVQKNDKLFSAIQIKTGSDTITLHFKALVDCSGNSIISELGKLPLITSENYQAAAQIFTLQGIGDIGEATLGLALLRDVQKGISNAQLNPYFDRVSVVQGSLENHQASFKLGLPIPVTYQKNNLEELKAKALEMVHTLSTFLISNSLTFKNAKLHHIAPELGIRTGFRPEGKYILTEEDVLSCKKFETAIANGAWPIEEWSQDKRVKMQYFEYEHFYQIPAESLISKHCENLFFAGRNISATDGAIASARVMGICFQTGFAAGKLAAASATKTDTEATIKAIQQEQIF